MTGEGPARTREPGPWIVEKRQWPPGICGAGFGGDNGPRVVSREAFEDRVQLRRALTGPAYFDLEGVAGDPRSSQQEIDAARFRLEAVMAGGPGRLRDGAEITVVATTYRTMLEEVRASGRPLWLATMNPEDRILTAWNEVFAVAVYARGGER